MAVVTYSTEYSGRGIRVILWDALANGDTGSPYTVPANWSDRSVQVQGTFGVGGSVALQGSNNVSTPSYGVLHKADGVTDANITDNEPVQLLENTMIVRPNVTAGDGTTSVAVRLSISTIARR